ncbi:MAG: VTT domain-containing protein [Bacillota bacterium]|nr:VTT domain-containing protein [Bacillota bacterium]
METVEPVEQFYDMLEMIVTRYGPYGIALVMAAESAGLPFASIIIILTAGTLILRGSISFFTVFLASTIGITIGSIISYLLGLLGNMAGTALRNFYRFRHNGNKPLLEKKRKSSRALQFWERYGNFSIFMAQLWGVTRTFISFPAGVMHMNFLFFVVYTFLGGAIYSLSAIAISIALAGTMGYTIKILRVLAGLSPWLLLIPVLLVAALIYLYRRNIINPEFFIKQWSKIKKGFKGY